MRYVPRFDSTDPHDRKFRRGPDQLVCLSLCTFRNHNTREFPVRCVHGILCSFILHGCHFGNSGGLLQQLEIKVWLFCKMEFRCDDSCHAMKGSITVIVHNIIKLYKCCTTAAILQPGTVI